MPEGITLILNRAYNVLWLEQGGTLEILYDVSGVERLSVDSVYPVDVLRRGGNDCNYMEHSGNKRKVVTR